MAGLGYASEITGAGENNTSKAELKRALDPTPGKVDTVKEIFPAVAPGMRPTPPVIEAAYRAADYYRYGATGDLAGLNSATGVAGLPARIFSGFDVDDKSASIRIFGRGPKGKTEQDLIPAYSKFFLEAVQESHSERSQIVETFGDFYVFMFGQKPAVYSFSGQLVNSKNANWVSDFMLMYELYLRGTKCVELDARAVITYGGRQIEGFILNISTQTQAAVEGAVGINFQVLVTDKKLFGFSEDMGVFTGSGASSVDAAFQTLMNEIAGKTGSGTSKPEVSQAQGEVKKSMAGGTGLAGLVRTVA